MTPIDAWWGQKVALHDGVAIPTSDLLPPPPIRIGVTVRSATRRYTDPDTGATALTPVGGLVLEVADPYPVIDCWRGVIFYWSVAAGDIDWDAYSGAIRDDLLRDMIRRCEVNGGDNDVAVRRLNAALRGAT